MSKTLLEQIEAGIDKLRANEAVLARATPDDRTPRLLENLRDKAASIMAIKIIATQGMLDTADLLNSAADKIEALTIQRDRAETGLNQLRRGEWLKLEPATMYTPSTIEARSTEETGVDSKTSMAKLVWYDDRNELP